MQPAIIARVVAADGRRDELVDVLSELVRSTHEEAGTEVYVVHADDEDADVLWVYEAYADPAAFAAHVANDVMSTLTDRLDGLLAEPPQISRLTTRLSKGLAAGLVPVKQPDDTQEAPPSAIEPGGLFEKRTIKHLAFTDIAGATRSTPIFAVWDGSALTFSTMRSRRKAKSIAQTPEVAISILDPEDEFHYVELRGSATLLEDPGAEFANSVWEHYMGSAYDGDLGAGMRIQVRITPSVILEHRSDVITTVFRAEGS